MRLLVDEDVDVRIIGVLKRLGHDARRVPSGTKNGAVIQLARRETRVLLTRDADFTNVGLYPPSRCAGIIHIAIHPPWFENIVPPLTRLLKSVDAQDMAGTLIVLEATGYHALP